MAPLLSILQAPHVMGFLLHTRVLWPILREHFVKVIQHYTIKCLGALLPGMIATASLKAAQPMKSGTIALRLTKKSECRLWS
jgi:hypothetical protein